MKRIATIVENGRVVGLVHGPDAYNQSITVNGRIWRFDFDEMFGPLWLKADGTTERKNQNPSRRVWLAWEEWHKAWREEKAKSPNEEPSESAGRKETLQKKRPKPGGFAAAV